MTSVTLYWRWTYLRGLRLVFKKALWVNPKLAKRDVYMQSYVHALGCWTLTSALSARGCIDWRARHRSITLTTSMDCKAAENKDLNLYRRQLFCSIDKTFYNIIL
jgi:hypothetical protein